MAIRKFLNCLTNYSKNLSAKEHRFLYFTDAPEKGKSDAKKDFDNMSEDDFKTEIAAQTGNEIQIGQAQNKDKKDRVMFKMTTTDGTELPRSFLYTEKFGKELRKLMKKSTTTPNEIKRAVYQELLRLTKDEIETAAESIRKELSSDTAKTLTKEALKEAVKASNKEIEEAIKPITTVGGPAEDKPPQAVTQEKDKGKKKEGPAAKANLDMPDLEDYEKANTEDKKTKQKQQIAELNKLITDEQAKLNALPKTGNKTNIENAKTQINNTIAKLRTILDRLNNGEVLTLAGKEKLLQGSSARTVETSSEPAKTPTPAPTEKAPEFVEKNKEFIRKLHTELQTQYKDNPTLDWKLIEKDASDYNKFKLEVQDKATNKKIVSISTIATTDMFFVDTTGNGSQFPHDINNPNEVANKEKNAKTKFEEILKDFISGKTLEAAKSTRAAAKASYDKADRKEIPANFSDTEKPLAAIQDILSKSTPFQFNNGEILTGERHPTTNSFIKGQAILPSGAILEGEFDGKSIKKGRSISPDGVIWEGEFYDRSLINGIQILKDGTINIIKDKKIEKIIPPAIQKQAIPGEIKEMLWNRERYEKLIQRAIKRCQDTAETYYKSDTSQDVTNPESLLNIIKGTTPKDIHSIDIEKGRRNDQNILVQGIKITDTYIMMGEFNPKTGLIKEGTLIGPGGLTEGTWDDHFSLISGHRLNQDGTIDMVTNKVTTKRIPRAVHTAAPALGAAPETIAENEVVKNANAIADAAAKVAEGAEQKAKDAGEREAEEGEKKGTDKTKKGSRRIGIFEDGKFKEGTVATKDDVILEGLFDEGTKQITFGKVTFKSKEIFLGNFHKEGGGTSAGLEQGRHISADGQTIEEGKFYKEGGLQEGRRTTTKDGTKTIEIGQFDQKTGRLVKGLRILPDGKKEEGEWDEKGKAKPGMKTIAALAAAPAEPPKAKDTDASKAAPALTLAQTSAQRLKQREEAEADTRAKERVLKPIEQWEEIFTKDNPVHKSVADLGEKGLFNPEGIEEKWKDIKGSARVDKILARGPFQIDKAKTGRFITQVITEGANDTVTFKDVFTFAKQYNKNFPYSDYDEFIDKFKELRKDPKNTDTNGKATGELRKMFDEVIYPTVELLDTIKELDYKGERPKAVEISDEDKQRRVEQYRAEIDLDKKLSLKQELMRDNLYGMFQYSEREPGGWERMMAWFKGDKDEVPTMTDVNGEIKFLDRGILRRSYDPKAAFKIFLETRGMYKVDNNDRRTIDEKQMLAEINRLIRLGGMSIAMQKLMFADEDNKKTPEELQRAAKARPQRLIASVKELEIKNLENLTPAQLDAFQLGFIISQEMKEAKELRDIQKTLGDANDKSPEGQKNQAIAVMVQNLKEQNVPAQDIAKIQDTLFAIGEITFDSSGNMISHGAAFNKRIMLRPGIFLTIGGVKLEKGGTPIIAITAAYEGDNFKASATLELDFTGASIGGSIAWEDVNIGFNRAKITVGAGARANFKNFDISLGAGAMITRRRVDIVAKENSAAMEKEAGLASRNWEDFKKSKGQPVEKRYAQLKGIPNLFNNVIEPFQATFKATDADMVYLMDSLKDEITNRGIDKVASSWTEFFHGVGLGLKLTTKPPYLYVGVFEFKIGSAKVYIPNRSEIGKMRDALSGRMAERKLELAIAEIDRKIAAGEALQAEAKPVAGKPEEAAEKPKEPKTETFKKEDTLPGAVSYGKDGMPKVHIKDANFSFSARLVEEKSTNPDEPAEPTAEKPPETEADKLARFNKGVRGLVTGPDDKEKYDPSQDAEVQLGEEKDGMREFKVLNTYNKDVEVYIDPNLSLSELGLLVKGGKLYLTGNTDDIAISRERFFMPYQSQKSASNIKDVIVIRNRSSIAGKVTRDWIEKYSGAYAEKLEGDSGFSFEKGYAKTPQANIKEETLTPADEAELQAFSKTLTKPSADFEARKAKNAATKAALAAEKQKVADRNKDIDARALEAKEMDKSTDGRHKVIGAVRDYEKQEKELSDAYIDDIYKLAKDKKEFQKELGEITGDDESIKELIIKYSQKTNKKTGELLYPALEKIGEPGHEAELDNAVTIVLNQWFLPLYKKGTENNKKIHKILDRRINFAQRSLEKGFTKAIADINKRLPTDKQIDTAFAAKAAKTITDNIYKTIREGKFDFSELKWSGDNRGIANVDEDATLFSTTRQYDKKGKLIESGVLAKTIAYKSWGATEAQGEKYLNHGFIKAAMQEYKINEGTDEEKQIARLLLEMASPSPEAEVSSSPEKAEKFLKSPLAVKLAGLETLMLVPELGKEKFDKITDLYDSMQKGELDKKLQEPGYKEALEAYRKIVQEIRDAQVAGKPYESKKFIWGDDEYIVRLNMTTKIVSGAYARCANASFSVKEDGDVEIIKTQKPIEPGKYKYEEPGKPKEPANPIVVYMESTEIVKSQQGKERVTGGAAVGMEQQEEPVTPKAEIPKTGGKQAEQGIGTHQGGKRAEPVTPAEMKGDGTGKNLDF